ncbi:MAG: hypothetical protein Q8Q94_02880 [bacterium]|nr:hypothetical protein [bacterium]MDZ4285426.1 hypothetical protein [Candidatus Sungbacteria bacterium]
MHFLKQFFEKKHKKDFEQKVLLRYQALAGLVGNGGEMINRDKESRARAWVHEQEKLLAPKEAFWSSRTIQAAFIGGVFVLLATIVTLYLSK